MSTEQTEEPTRRRRRHLPVLSVAAAVVLIGGGSAYWAYAAGNGGGSAPAASDEGGAPPPLTLDDLGSPSPGHSDVTGIAPGEPNPYGTRYRAAGELPDGPGSAAVYRPGDMTRAEVTELARALDVSARPVQENGGWRVGGHQDGTGPVLRVGTEQADGSWSFSRYGPGAPACMKPLPEKGPARAERPKPSCPSQGPADGGVAKGEPVSEEQAEQAVRAVLKPLGLPHAKLSASGTQGAKRLVTADPVVDGLPTLGWSSTFTVGADGTLVRGHGRLGGLDKGATYPVLGAEQTLQQLNDSRGGSSSVAPGEPDPSGGKQATATVTDARFGLETHFSHGDPLLVPSWSFTVQREGGKDTYTVGYPAVKPSLLHLPGEPQRPSPRPSAPRGGEQIDAPTAYRADGRTLTLTFWGGVCGDHRGVAKETDKRVTVSVERINRDPDKLCIKLAKRQTVRVTLDEPLGDRTVVSGRNGKPVPAAKG